MENKETILNALEEFARRSTEDIPPVLEQYLRLVANTGETIFPWPKLKPLFVKKLEMCMVSFFEDCPTDDLPALPNVENVRFQEMRERVLNYVNKLNGVPFTIQRLCELITNPKRHYKRTDKFLRGLEKNVMVVSTVDPYGNKIVSESKASMVNGMDSNGFSTPKLPQMSAFTSGAQFSYSGSGMNAQTWMSGSATSTWPSQGGMAAWSSQASTENNGMPEQESEEKESSFTELEATSSQDESSSSDSLSDSSQEALSEDNKDNDYSSGKISENLETKSEVVRSEDGKEVVKSSVAQWPQVESPVKNENIQEDNTERTDQTSTSKDSVAEEKQVEQMDMDTEVETTGRTEEPQQLAQEGESSTELNNQDSNSQGFDIKLDQLENFPSQESESAGEDIKKQTVDIPTSKTEETISSLSEEEKTKCSTESQISDSKSQTEENKESADQSSQSDEMPESKSSNITNSPDQSEKNLQNPEDTQLDSTYKSESSESLTVTDEPGKETESRTVSLEGSQSAPDILQSESKPISELKLPDSTNSDQEVKVETSNSAENTLDQEEAMDTD